MTTQEIYNFRKVDELISTGGQPTQAQLESAAGEGFQAVINLATFQPDHSLVDEENIVRTLGMDYYSIPVDWRNPTLKDFEAFEKLLQQTEGAKTLIHCAANFRVTAFYGLYALKYLGWSETKADAFRMSVWQGSDYPIWEKFIRELKTQIIPGG